jgi:hypothetical protein
LGCIGCASPTYIGATRQYSGYQSGFFLAAVLLEGKEGWIFVGFYARRDLAQKKQGEPPGSIFVCVRELDATEADESKAEATIDAEQANQEAETAAEHNTPKLTISRITEKLLMEENLG